MRSLLPLGLVLLFAGMTLVTSESSGKSVAGGPVEHSSLRTSNTKMNTQDSIYRIDQVALMRDLSILAHDSMEGRGAGTEGGERARRFLISAFPEKGLTPMHDRWTDTFSFRSGGTETVGTNIWGVVQGRESPDEYIVVTAHYDHLGVRGSEIFNGADDNASGTAALLALAHYFSSHPTRHSLLFVAFDAEEVGLRGAEAFVANPPIPLSSILLNINLDMVSRSEEDELYAVGTHHYPSLLPLVEETARHSRISLLAGHDTPGLPPGDDWTFASDHGPFHRAEIPFLYFGVEDHAGYHTPSDTYEAITAAFYLNAVETILDFVLLADEAGEALHRPER